MSLRLRFSLLFTAILGTLIVCVGATTWAVGRLHTDVAGAFVSITDLVRQYGEVEDASGSISREFRAMDRRRRAGQDVTEFSPETQFDLTQLRGLVYVISTRTDTWAVQRQLDLSSHVDRAILAIPDPEQWDVVVESLELVARLAGTAQQQLFGDIDEITRYADYVQFQVSIIMVADVLVAGLLTILSVKFVSRWVTVPIGQLRDATAQIARGNFDHRIESMTADELGRLADEINDMCHHIVTMQRRLVESERRDASAEMVRRLAHNIRNPLAGIRNLAELSRRELPADARTREHQERILAAVDQFERWLHTLQTSTGELRLRLIETDPTDILKRVIHAHRPLADASEITLTLDVDEAPQRVRVDPVYVEQVIAVLVTNALQHAPSRSKVRIVCRVAETGRTDLDAEGSTDRWQIEVTDEGPGVASDVIETIFRPYVTTRSDGTGLGLALAANVVEKHEGCVEIDQTYTDGARFVVELPGVVVGRHARAESGPDTQLGVDAATPPHEPESPSSQAPAAAS